MSLIVSEICARVQQCCVPISDYCEPVDGVCVIDEEYMRGRKVFGHLVTVYRYGREEDEVMGVKFSKEMIIAKEQVYPMVNAKVTLSEFFYFRKKIIFCPFRWK